jgi:hypothetical protein
MIMKTRIFLLCCTLLLLSGCQTTEVLNTWSSDSKPHKFNKVLVLAALKEPVYRDLLEQKLVTALKADGITAVAASSLYPEAGEMTEAMTDAAVKQAGADAVMVIRLVDTRKEVVHTPGTVYVPGGYGGRYGYGYYGYYGGAYTAFSSPGYSTEYNIATVETTVFSAASNKRAWSTITETTETSVNNAIDSYIKTIGKSVKSSGLF